MESMAVAEGASPTSAALRSGMWSFFEIRQGKKQPVSCLCRLGKALVYKVGTASRLMKHLSGAHAIQWQAHQIKE